VGLHHERDIFHLLLDLWSEWKACGGSRSECLAREKNKFKMEHSLGM
jgi:hypothetical protein